MALRVAQLVDVRAKFFEATAPFARALAAQSLVGAASEQARRVSRDALDAQRADTERVFRGELDALPSAERAELLEALAHAASAPTWESLRRSRGLSMARARAVVGRTLTALLRDAGVALP